MTNEEIREQVEHPKRYTDNFSGIEVIESNCDLNNCLSNVFKYCMRAGKKDNIIQELEKAKFYCEFYINGVEEGKITPQHKITEYTFNNIKKTAKAAIMLHTSVALLNDSVQKSLNLEAIELKSLIFSYFYEAIKATQEIRFYNRKINIRKHLNYIRFVASYITKLIIYYIKIEDKQNEQ